MENRENQQPQLNNHQQATNNHQQHEAAGLGQGKVWQELAMDPFVETDQYAFLSRVYRCPMQPGQSVYEYKQKIRQLRQTLILYNLPNFCYSRAHHYHFFLDDFPRIEGQLSYALDEDNAFGFTYPQDDRLYQGQRLGDIVNRVAFTLPGRYSDRDYFPPRKSGSTQNEAHRLLFANENAKIELDRTLLTIKKILKNYEKIGTPEKLSQFALVASDGGLLSFLLSDEYNSFEKREMLEQVIDNLQETKQQKIPSFEVNDYLYFPSSLQQRLHDAIENQERIQQKIQRKMIKNYVNKYEQTRENLRNIEMDSQAMLAKLLLFYKTNVLSVSQEAIQKLVSYIDVLRDTELVLMPIAIFDFGSQVLRKKVNNFIMSYLTNNQVQAEQNIIVLLSKIFNTDLDYDRPEKEMSFLQSKFLTRDVVNKLQKQFQNEPDEKTIPLLDQAVRFDKLDNISEDSDFFALFSHGEHKLIVSQEETKTIIYYNRICKVFKLLEPLLHENEDLMDVLCSGYFDNLMHGIIGHIPRKIIGKLPDYVKNLVSHAILASFENSDQVKGINLEFEFSIKSGIGLLWNTPTVDREGSEVPWSLVVEHPSVFHAVPPELPRPQEILKINEVEEEEPPMIKKIKPNEDIEENK